MLLISTLEGAPHPHWAFQPLGERTGSLDEFVLQKLKQEGLERSPFAERHTLIRRLSFDLRGIPPTGTEVAAFEADDSPEAWPKVVERYLVSPHFGERMAQHWLDLARYGDTSGYAADRTRTIWPYRDWVIGAYNENKPFDQFIVEQLAGDLLPNATPEQKLATGFHRNAMQAKGNNPRKEEFRIKGVVDRLTTTGRGLMGLSIECAECHDHKYDPISQREYYELFAIFNNVPHLGEGYGVHGPLMDYWRPAAREERRQLQRQLGDLPPPTSWPNDGVKPLGVWHKNVTVEDATKFSVKGDLSITAKIRTSADVAGIASKYDWRGKQRGYVFGIGGEGDTNGVPGHLFAWISKTADPFAGVEIHSSRPVNDGKPHDVALVARAGKSIHLIIDGVEDTAAKVIGKMPDAIAASDRRLSIGAGYNDSATPDAFRFEGELTDVRIYDVALDLPLHSPERMELEAALAKLDADKLVVPVMAELPEPRAAHVLVRGNFKEKGAQVSPAVPKALPPMKSASVDRLSFARWLVQENRSLTSRVAVNYLWQHFFGTGLVATSSDFGVQGSPPTHPELLDWLASEFIQSGWDRKHVIRLIVYSAAYRQSSPASDASFLAGMPRLRHSAEQIRDNALIVSGLIVPDLGGPPVFPLQPDGYYEERGQNTAGNSNFTWVASSGQGRYRKTLYTYWKRMALHPSLAAFDAPARQVCEARRSVTNTPQQALVTLNDPVFHECAVAFGRRIKASAKSDSARIDYAFAASLSREPDASEREQFLGFVHGRENPWESVAVVLLNLDEFLTRE